jgi:MoaA/NifB/PqqE/SkfB family radical SAM enzyme
MLDINHPIMEEMRSDERYFRFVVQLGQLLRKDPEFSARELTKIFDAAARGERVVKFKDQYVVSSWVPPIPSEAFLTFIRGGLSEETLFSDLAHGRRSAPLSAHLCITARCMYRCDHCGATTPDRNAELTKDQWIRVMAQLQDLGVAFIGISGGEPLLRDDLEEIIASIDDRSTTLMFTNGYGYTLERARSIKEAGLFYSAISLDSPYPEEHNRVRRNSKAFDRAMVAIHNSLEAELYTMISTVVFRRDLTEQRLDDLYRLATKNGVHEVRIHQPIPRGELAEPEMADQVFWKTEDVDRWLDMQEAANQAHDGLKVSSFPYTEGPRKFGCNAGLLHLYISASGDVWPCDFIPLTFGNVVQEDVKDIYRRLQAETGITRQRCWAKRVAARLLGRELPLGPDDSTEFCQGCDMQPSFGDFFKTLQGDTRPSDSSHSHDRRTFDDGLEQFDRSPRAAVRKCRRTATR